MCGIAGIWNLNGNQLDYDQLRRFTDTLAHRGPDGSGYLLLDDHKLGFGHRRLSILDTSDHSAQPMTYADERYTMVYNGEVYNFLELKKELEKDGHTFRSNGDTEVILAAWTEWGINCLNRFNGMWAFAIWDNLTKELHLARDRFGIKPLYYLDIPGKIFAFSSETHSFKLVPGYERSFNLENVNTALVNNLLLEGMGCTIYNDIWQVLPGHYLKLSQNNNSVKQCRWYNILDKVARVSRSYADQVDQFKELFEDSCRIRLRSDVPVASALSGGLDSSSVYSMVHHLKRLHAGGSRESDNWQMAFTASFPGTDRDEVEFARIVAMKYGVENWRYFSNDMNNLAGDIQDTTIKYDTISNTPISSITPIYKAIKSAGVTVSLDGHGADEMLFGYRYSLYDLFSNYLMAGKVSKAVEISNVLIDLYADKDKNRIERKLNSAIQQLNQEQNKHLVKVKRFLRSISYRHKPDINPVNIIIPDSEPYDFRKMSADKEILYNSFFKFSLPTLLCNFDRASMFNGVEVRMPFMDYRLVEFCFSLPTDSKVGNGYSKRILRDAMRGIVPDAIIKRKGKIGISAPLENWLKGSLKEWAMENMKNDRFDYVSGLLGANSTELRNDLNNGTIGPKQAQQIWMGLNFSLLKA